MRHAPACLGSALGRAARILAAGALLVSAPGLRAQRAAVEGRRGMVASAHELASQAGLRILRMGGNAVDAAVATGLALAVVHPQAGNLGGGGFMVIHAASGLDTVIDYRECAPGSATRDMFVGPDGKVLQGEGSSTLGWRAAGVPGTVAGFHLAFTKYGSGKVPWAEVVEPAVELAAGGFRVSQGLARALAADRANLERDPETRRIFMDGRKDLAAGRMLVQKDLGETLQRLQADPRDFYEGRTARLLDAAMAAHGGAVTLADLRAYRAVERQPLRISYRGHDIVTMPPPSSGGIVLAQILKMIEPYDVGAQGPGSAARVHLFAEAMARAYRDRAEYLGDADFVQVPVKRLLDPAYLKARMADFDPAHATPAAKVQPGLGAYVHAPARPEHPETTHFSVVDEAGNAVANTYTLNDAFGARVTAPGTGFLLNDEMDDFTARVGSPNLFGLLQSEANAIAPGKRPLSSMTPAIVSRDGKVLLVTGSPGGSTIINTVLEIITHVIDDGMPVMQAVEAPRFHAQWMPDVLFVERYGLSPDTRAILKGMGHVLKEGTPWGSAYQGDGQTIGMDRERGVLLGAADPRDADGKAVGY